MIYLTKIDAARNMARFYALNIQPTLFGEWALMKEWGRTGRRGPCRAALFAGQAALGRELKRRDRRGYAKMV
jgi:predicted DNA-binding WGR domain protein